MKTSISTVRRGIPLVLCAPSGAGKTTLAHRLRTEFPDLGFSISVTTRRARAGEEHGKDYFFISREDFFAQREANEFAEWAEVYGNFYGTPLRPVQSLLHAGQDVFFDIDVQGAAQLRLTLPHCLCIFCFPPSLCELEKRLRGRATDAEASIERRLQDARQEIREAHWFDTWIVNDNVDAAYDALRSAYIAATCAPKLRPTLPCAILEG